MNGRTSVVLAVGFGILIALIAGLGVGAVQRATLMYSEMQSSQDSYLQSEALCRGISSEMYSAGIVLRDYLLESGTENATAYRNELILKRTAIERQLDVLSHRISAEEKPRLDRLQIEAHAYWNSLDPLFDWSAKDKASKSWVFVASKVVPHRDAVLNLSKELGVINANTLQHEREKLRESQEALREFLVRMVSIAMGIGVLAAGMTIYKVSTLERLRAEQSREIQKGQDDMRRLSQRLVELQEAERRSLSRELHDQVGQTMTAIGIHLGNLETVRSGDEEVFRRRIEELKHLNSDAMRTVRDLAMGLRPSMLDDLGLEAALKWQGREFSRHTGVPSEVRVEGHLDDLSEAQKTCIYRVVQEALTNCARHAKAASVLVSVSSVDADVAVVVRDDGIGFNSTITLRGGLGLLSMKERVQALDGSLDIVSEPRQGTVIRAQIPLGATS